MKVASWMIVGVCLNAAHLSMGQSAAPPQQPSPSTPGTAITGSANINPSNSASQPLVIPTIKPNLPDPAQPSPISAPGPPILCSDQTVFELCLKNQDNYIKACKPEEYACLCRWHSSKLSCFDNCPQDVGRPEQNKIVKDTCSQPGANVTLPAQTLIPPTSSILPSTTGRAPVSSSTTSNSNHKSAANQIASSPQSNDILYLAIALMMVGWMF